MARKDGGTQDVDAELRDQMRSRFYQERLQCPFPWLQLDTDWYDDEKLQRLRDLYGKAAITDFMMLIARLANKRHHSYDVSTDGGWRRLSRDLEMDSDEECRERMGQFAELGLINRIMFTDHGKVQNNRVMTSAETYAKSAAQADYMTWRRTRK